MLPNITVRVLSHLNIPDEVWREVLLLFLNLLFGPQLVIEGVPFLFLKPVGHLGIAHMLHFHFSGHDAEISTSYLGQHFYLFFIVH
jgi:hypothetical protein